MVKRPSAGVKSGFTVPTPPVAKTMPPASGPPPTVRAARRQVLGALPEMRHCEAPGCNAGRATKQSHPENHQKPGISLFVGVSGSQTST
jgi:hypothetical protein